MIGLIDHYIQNHHKMIIQTHFFSRPVSGMIFLVEGNLPSGLGGNNMQALRFDLVVEQEVC